MLLSDGNVGEYETLKQSSTETYLLKLENHVEKIESMKKQSEELKRKR
jgi:hypothetical protein